MTIQQIKKSISIKSGKDKVWDVLIKDEYNRIWFAEFGSGTHAVTDWREGSKVIYKDAANGGMIGKILVNKPGELLSVEYAGLLKENKEDFESDVAKEIIGGKETYRLAEKEGVTILSIECDMGEEYYEMMSGLWDKALEKIILLAEAK